MGRLLRWFAGALLATVLSVATFVAVLWYRTDDRVLDIPFSGATSRGRVGTDWAERTGDAGDPVDGESDDVDEFARLDFDTAVVDPEVRRFYERTADDEMAYDVTWHHGFRVGAWLASFATNRLESSMYRVTPRPVFGTWRATWRRSHARSIRAGASSGRGRIPTAGRRCSWRSTRLTPSRG